MTLVLLTFAVGCGTAESTVDATASTTPAPLPTQPHADADGFGLHDAGPVAGLMDFSFVRTADPTRCGGFAVTVAHAPNTYVDANDQALVDFLAITYPVGLDFSDAHREQAKADFDHWLADTQQRALTAIYAFTRRGDAVKEPRLKVVLDARIIQTYRYFADLLMRAEIPIDDRTGEYADGKRDAFCDALAASAKPLLTKASKIATVCASTGKSLPPGWWTSVCVP